jgi:hypothetical protein
MTIAHDDRSAGDHDLDGAAEALSFEDSVRHASSELRDECALL